jgi:hypothetical protein
VLLIGIEAEGDIEEIIQAAGSVATDTLPGDEPIDICQVVEGEKGISHFMIAHITPFYERAGAVSCAISKQTALSDARGEYTPLLPAAVNPSAAPDSTQTTSPRGFGGEMHRFVIQRKMQIRHRQRIGRGAGKRDDRHADVFGNPRFIQHLFRFAAARDGDKHLITRGVAEKIFRLSPGPEINAVLPSTCNFWSGTPQTDKKTRRRREKLSFWRSRSANCWRFSS